MQLSKSINLYPKPHAGQTTRELAVSTSGIKFTGNAGTLVIGDETNYITYTSVAKDESANGITIAYVQSADTNTTVSVSGQAITVAVGFTDPDLTGTLADIKTAIDGTPAAAALVTCAITGTTTTVPALVAATNLSGGKEAFNKLSYYVLVNVKSNSVYVTFDDSTPSATNGVTLPSGYLEIWSSHAARAAKFVQGSGAARVTGVPFTD